LSGRKAPLFSDENRQKGFGPRAVAVIAAKVAVPGHSPESVLTTTPWHVQQRTISINYCPASGAYGVFRRQT